ncbi:MAG TPA: SpoIIE family protein phosphatase [Streptosporangiaceae bacterium]
MESVHETGSGVPGDESVDVLRELRRLMPQRPTIEEAKSALATYLGCTETTALTQLVNLAEDTGTSLAEVTAALAGAPDSALVPEAEPAMFDPLPYLLTSEYDEPAAIIDAPRPGEGHVAPDRVAPEVHAVLDAIHVEAVYLSPLLGEHGEVADFVITAGNQQALARFDGTGEEFVGVRFSRFWQPAMAMGMLDAYREVLRTGTSLARGPFRYDPQEGSAEQPVMLSIRASRVGDGVVLSWRVHDERDEVMDRLRQVQRLTNLGWAEWDLTTDEISWSPGMYRVFGRAPTAGPISLSSMSAVVLPADLPIVREAARTVFEKREPSFNEFRIRRDGEVAYVRLLAEPVLDAQGRPVRIRGTATDVTKQRRDERALESARAQITRQRQTSAVQQRVARELRQAILPIQNGTVRTSGLRYSVRYLAAESNARIGGDWYTVGDMPDGRVLIGIGDAAGHGLPATALMARMRNGLAGLSYTGARSGKLMTWLNELVYFDTPQETATAIIGHYAPETRELTWSRAGHPPPVLVRDGTAELLDGANGTLLGAVGKQEFRQTVTRLQPGDLLLFYTDGLVERRDADIDEGIDALATAAAACRGADPTADIATVLGKLELYTPEDDTCLLAIRVE